MIVRDHGGGFHDDDADCPECAAVGVELSEGGMGISHHPRRGRRVPPRPPRLGRHDPHAHQALRRLSAARAPAAIPRRRLRSAGRPAARLTRYAPARGYRRANVTARGARPAGVAELDRRRPRAPRSRRARRRSRATPTGGPLGRSRQRRRSARHTPGPGAARRAADADRGGRQEMRLSARGGGAGRPDRPGRGGLRAQRGAGRGRQPRSRALRGRARQGGRTACRGRRAGQPRCSRQGGLLLVSKTAAAARGEAAAGEAAGRACGLARGRTVALSALAPARLGLRRVREGRSHAGAPSAAPRHGGQATAGLVGRRSQRVLPSAPDGGWSRRRGSLLWRRRGAVGKMTAEMVAPPTSPVLGALAGGRAAP